MQRDRVLKTHPKFYFHLSHPLIGRWGEFMATLYDAIREALSEGPGRPFSLEDISGSLGLPKDDVEKTVQLMVSDGLLSEIEPGRFIRNQGFGAAYELFRKEARRPVVRAASTWSFMSEISGLITTQVPSMMWAGSW